MSPSRYHPIAIIVLILASGCSSSSNPTALNYGYGQVGTVVGSVFVADTAGKGISPQGVLISLDKTGMNTTTDELGWWQLHDVPGGSYDITMSRTGCGKTRRFGVLIFGPGTTEVGGVGLAVLPTVVPILDSVKTDSTGIHLFANILDHMYFVMDQSPAVQSDEPHALLRWSQRGFGGSTITFAFSELAEIGIHPGDTLYASSFQSKSGTYKDPLTHKISAVSPSPRSNVIKVVVP